MKVSRSRSTLMLTAGLLLAVLPLKSAVGVPLWLRWGTKPEIVLPFRSIHDEMVVSFSINGHKEMNFVVDTGTALTIIDSSAATVANVKTAPLEAPPFRTAEGEVTMTKAAPDVRIAAHGLQIRGNVLVDDLGSLGKRLGIPLAGILGFDALGRFPFLIDYSGKTITVFPERSELRSWQRPIELRLQPPSREVALGPTVCLEVELPDGRGTRANLIVDTGSTNGLIFQSAFLERNGLQPEDPTRIVKQTEYDGTVDLVRGSTYALRLGTMKIQGLHALYAERKTKSSADAVMDGTIGNEILSRFRVYMDAPHQRVVFEPITAN